MAYDYFSAGWCGLRNDHTLQLAIYANRAKISQNPLIRGGILPIYVFYPCPQNFSRKLLPP